MSTPLDRLAMLAKFETYQEILTIITAYCQEDFNDRNTNVYERLETHEKLKRLVNIERYSLFSASCSMIFSFC